MKTSTPILLSIFVLTIFLWGNAANSGTSGNQTSLDLSGLDEMPYLEITSESDLNNLAQDEGWQGTGVFEDPYIIENYYFSGEVTDPELSQSIKSEQSLSSEEFNVFSIIISNIESYVIIRNNAFTYTLMINIEYSGTEGRIIIENNKWVTSDHPNNLLTIGDGFVVRLNQFYGSNFNCVVEYLMYPSRVHMKGSSNVIEKNIFEVDESCHPTQHLSISGSVGSGNAGTKIEIMNNWFKASDLAISLFAQADIFHNDFETGDNSIEIYYVAPDIYENNFMISNLGKFGYQEYLNTEQFILLHRISITSGTPPLITRNYYSDWAGEPDKDSNGIVDQPYNIGSSPMNQGGSYDLIDNYPSKLRYSTYYNPVDNENNLNWEAGIIGIALITMIAGSVYLLYTKYVVTQPLFSSSMPGKTKEVIKEIFKSQTVLYYTLMGQSKTDNIEIEEKIQSVIPKKIYDFKFLLHPIRMSMMKLLYENLEFSSIDLKDIMEINWNDFTNHSSNLNKKGYIKIEDGFVDGVKRQILSIEPKGTEEFKQLSDLLQLFLDNASDLAAYVKTAQQRLEGSDQELYPKS